MKNMYMFLSYTLNDKTPVYGGGERFKTEEGRSLKKGDTCNTSKWCLPNHIGTHIDFPRHFYENGQTISDFTAEYWVIDKKKTQVFEINLPKNDLMIKKEYITNKRFDFDAEFIIIKTGFGTFRNQGIYETHNPGVDISLCEWILDNFKKIRFIGLDSSSISSRQHRDIGRMVHKKFLNPKRPVLIIEDMDLSRIKSGFDYKKIIISPIQVNNSDGAPCNILVEL